MTTSIIPPHLRQPLRAQSRQFLTPSLMILSLATDGESIGTRYHYLTLWTRHPSLSRTLRTSKSTRNFSCLARTTMKTRLCEVGSWTRDCTTEMGTGTHPGAAKEYTKKLERMRGAHRAIQAQYVFTTRVPPRLYILTHADMQDEPMTYFLPRRGLLLDELLRREGRGDYVSPRCLDCASEGVAGPARVRCTTCPPGPLLCEACIVRKHADSPYHRTQVRFIVYCFMPCHPVLTTS